MNRGDRSSASSGSRVRRSTANVTGAIRPRLLRDRFILAVVSVVLHHNDTLRKATSKMCESVCSRGARRSITRKSGALKSYAPCSIPDRHTPNRRSGENAGPLFDARVPRPSHRRGTLTRAHGTAVIARRSALRQMGVWVHLNTRATPSRPACLLSVMSPLVFS